MDDYSIEKLFDVQQVQNLLESHVRVSGISCGLMDNCGEIIAAAGLQDICTRFHWPNAKTFSRCWNSNAAFRAELLDATEPQFETICPNGVVHIVLPIFAESSRVAVLFVGQFFYDDAPPDLDFFRKQGLQAGFDVGEYLAAVRRVPIFSHEYVEDTLNFLYQMVQMLADNSYTAIQRERELAEREQVDLELSFLSEAFKYSSESFFLVDQEYGFRYVNDAACRTLGYSHEELLTKNLMDIVPDLSEEKIREIRRASDRNRDGMTLESRHRRKDGHIFPVQITRWVFDHRGKRFGMVMARDLTEQKKADRQIKLLSNALDNVRESAFLISPSSGKFLYVNQEACRSLGYSNDELVGKSALDIDPNFTKESLNQNIEELLTSGSITFESCHRHRDGGIFPVEITGTIFEYDGIKYSLAMVRDISERKRLEREMSIFTVAFKHSVDASFIIDSSFNFQYANDEACRSLGYSREELLSMGTLDIDPDMTLDVLQKLRVESKDNDRIPPIETRHRTKDGRIFPVEVNSWRFEYEGVDYALSMARDISERKKIEHQLYLLNHALDHVREAAYLHEFESGALLYVNQEASRSLGYSAEELIGMAPFVYEPGFNEEKHQKVAEKLLSKGTLTFETHHQAKDGRIFPVEINATIFDYNGTQYALALVRDISERQQMMAELAVREREFRTLAENLPDNIARYDTDCRITYFNPRLCELLGFTKIPIGKLPVELTSDDRFKEYQKKISQVLDNSQEAEIDLVRTTSDGQESHNRIRFIPERDKSGVICGVLAISRDITDQKRAEEERLAHLYFLSSMDRVNRAIQEASDLDEMMSSVLEAVRAIYGCDRAYLLYPCDPEAEFWKIPMESASAEYPGAKDQERKIEHDDWIKAKHRLLLTTDHPVSLGVGTQYPSMPGTAMEQFQVKNVLATALYPMIDLPWEFGLHQCSRSRTWTTEEERLFQEIGRRLADGITSLLIHRDLRESEARYRMVFENSPVSIWEEDFSAVKHYFEELRAKGIEDIEEYFTKNPEAVHHCANLVNVVDMNRAALILHSATNKEEIRGGLGKCFKDETFTALRQQLVGLWRGKTSLCFDSEVRTLSGETRQVTIYVSICPGYELSWGKGLISFIDITERKLAEQELYEKQQRLNDMAFELALSEQRERRRIASELHDSLGQDLTLIKIKLGSLAKVASSVKQEKLIGSIKELTEDSIVRVRSMTRQLYPPVLESAGLEAALKWLVRQLEGDYDLQITFEDDQKSKTVAREFQMELYNCVRELLINVAKHAKTSTVYLAIAKEAETLIIQVEDDGCGFESGKVMQNQVIDGFGLYTIKHRIDYMGGSFHIRSTVGSGTEVTIKVPIGPIVLQEDTI